MAYALGFPKDVTDCIYSMRDWRWEMVRDGGKTPSADCFTTRFDQETSDKKKPCIEPCHDLPTFISTPYFNPLRLSSGLNVPKCEERPDRTYWFNPPPDKWEGSIDVWEFDDQYQDWGQTTVMTPTHSEIRTRVGKPEDLWWQCEQCRP